MKPEARPAIAPRRWARTLATYTAVAILAAIVAILFAHSRYDKLVPPDRAQATPGVPKR